MTVTDWAHLLSAMAGVLGVSAAWSRWMLGRVDKKSEQLEKTLLDLNTGISNSLRDLHTKLHSQIEQNQLLIARVYALEGFLAAKKIEVGDLPDTPGWPIRT